LNAVPVSNGSHTVVPVYLPVMMSLSLNLYPFTEANACQQTGSRLIAFKTRPNAVIATAKQAQGEKRQFDVHSVIGPFTSLA